MTSVSVVTAFDIAVKPAVKELAGTETDEGTDSKELFEFTVTVTGVGYVEGSVIVQLVLFPPCTVKGLQLTKRLWAPSWEGSAAQIAQIAANFKIAPTTDRTRHLPGPRGLHALPAGTRAPFATGRLRRSWTEINLSRLDEVKMSRIIPRTH